MRAVINFQFYKDLPVVRAWTTVCNISCEGIGLEYVLLFAYTGLSTNNPRILIPHNSWRCEANWMDYSVKDLGLNRNCEFSMKRIFASNTGMWSCKEYIPMAAFYDEKTTIIIGCEKILYSLEF